MAASIALLALFAARPAIAVVGNWTALAACLPTTAFGVWVVHRLQRYRRMPVWLTLGAVGWGATGAAGFASGSNLAFSRYAHAVLDDATATVLLFVHIGVFEEVGKVVGVALVYALARRHLDGVVSGIVLGAAVGLGFNLTETVAYMSGGDAAYQYWGRQSIVGLMGAHTAFSALAGAGFGVARQLREPRRRRIAIACGFLVAAGGHVAAISAMRWFSEQVWLAANPTLDVIDLSPLPMLLAQGPLALMYLVLLRHGLRDQAAALATHLPAEASTGLGAVTDAEVAVLLAPSRRLWLRITMLRRYGLSACRNLDRLHAAQLDLATQRWHRARQEVDDSAPHERALRERVWRLKHRQADLMAARPRPAQAWA